ncbi:glycyl-radical enzyme activating protein [Thermosediminibacter litoriperuensis]|uniref:Pyruvate formate lyase activating enzyme n=1 Tax=Thermosediminibacter litoriperuensis TaxID=291989 RepID=A0A5S5ASL8_9FIRM|nr:glycyl-radical enzyme activating protein [Thermosediminibacter litoriperuensis]TYP55437.1 pyruvate formate lyase activating enzyme [Thermosediminibacter litoriperuensis]
MVDKGLIFDIKRFAIHDGPGIRTTVFLKGCPLRCWWCHNPEGISPMNELMFFEYKCMGCQMCAGVCPAGAVTYENNTHNINGQKCIGCGICSEACPTGALKLVGRVITIEELMEEIERDILLYDNSDGGVTFSGGEPLSQHRFLKEVLKECKKRGVHTALDTSGYAPADVFASVMDYVDVFLFDLKLADDEEHRKYTGVSNEPIKENLRMLADTGRGGDVILRLPVIPGITDTEKNIEGLLEFVASLKDIRRIDLLSFHDVSEKYCRLGREYKMPACSAPPPERLRLIKDRFERIGLIVKM